MMNMVLSHQCNCSYQGQALPGRFNGVSSSRYSGVYSPLGRVFFFQGQFVAVCYRQSTRKYRIPFCSTTDDGTNSDDLKDENEGKESSKDESEGKESSKDKTGEINSDQLRENLEKTIGRDDSAFNGLDLATLIRKKYGRSYDVQLIKKEFMGRNLLAMNVMWKYVEQRSFPLTEEEYIIRLDDVANALKCWGAVQHIRNSLERSKERPRIGKAVCIFIDMDLKGGRANEWIYK